jgi:hypothetical protein
MPHEMTAKGLVRSLPGAADVTVERHTYATAEGPLDFELYRASPEARAAVIFVIGYPDPGAAAFFGKPFKDWAMYQDWARLVAVSGLVGITYLNRDPGDVHALFAHLRANAASLGLDPARLAIWSSSGNVPNALAVLAREPVAAAALLYGYFLDLDGTTHVAQAAAQFHFATPAVSVSDLPHDVPLLVVQAGKDATPGLNETIERFVAAARDHLHLTYIIHATGPHAFDMLDDTPESRATIDEVLAFLRRKLV